MGTRKVHPTMKAYTDHLKASSAKYGIKYGKAMTDARCKKDWNKIKATLPKSGGNAVPMKTEAPMPVVSEETAPQEPSAEVQPNMTSGGKSRKNHKKKGGNATPTPTPPSTSMTQPSMAQPASEELPIEPSTASQMGGKRKSRKSKKSPMFY